ncbi:MAG: protein jag [Nitrospinae bacterium]|nr:protein jag [Nitrospinota bacterium]
MEWVEGEGTTEDDATADVMRKLGVASRDDIKVEVIGEERKLFGFGEKRVKVRAVLKPAEKTHVEKVEESINILQRLLDYMGIDGRVDGEEKEDLIYLTIFSEDSGILIGRRGETLDSLEHLVDRIVNRKFENRVSIIVDTEGYRENRREELNSLAKRIAQQVKTTGKPAVVASMRARDRKIIHIALKDDEEVETMSEGEGFERKVIISPKKRT